jgi:hypothetical protein
MPWYKAGTVSVTQNSSTVLGTGTAFIANGRVGDGFRGPDGGWYEVTNFASDTALSISPPYQGTTNAAGSYALAPLQGYVKDSADALRALVNQYGAKLAGLGTTGNYDILPIAKGGTGVTTLAETKANLGILDVQTVARGGTGATDAAGARTALGAAKSGANADITELNALTKALTVAQGGTGGSTQSAARSGLGLGSAAIAGILGTVSQSGGIPTGDIYQVGSTSNGRYIKYASGEMICYGVTGSVTANITTASGVMFFTSLSGAFPVPFLAGTTPVVFAQFTAAGRLMWSNLNNDPPANSYSIYVMATTSISVTGTLEYLAIGRWF